LSKTEFGPGSLKLTDQSSRRPKDVSNNHWSSEIKTWTMEFVAKKHLKAGVAPKMKQVKQMKLRNCIEG
jgi:hypothetical protein